MNTLTEDKAQTVQALRERLDGTHADYDDRLRRMLEAEAMEPLPARAPHWPRRAGVPDPVAVFRKVCPTCRRPTWHARSAFRNADGHYELGPATCRACGQARVR